MAPSLNTAISIHPAFRDIGPAESPPPAGTDFADAGHDNSPDADRVDTARAHWPENPLPEVPALPGAAGTGALAVVRIAERHWHALEDDRVVGRGEVIHRPDGRNFVSVDAWHSDIFAALSETMLAELPRPLYTLVDEADHELTSQWQWVGFTTSRREHEYLLPTGSTQTGLAQVVAPAGTTVLGLGEADPDLLAAVESLMQAEAEAETEAETAAGRPGFPAEWWHRGADPGQNSSDPSFVVVAAQGDRYVGLLRLAPSLRTAPRRRPRIALIAVQADCRRRSIARAMLAEALGSLHHLGHLTVSAEVNQSDSAATALFEGIGARQGATNLELQIR